MIQQALAEIGPWFWFVAGLVLLIGEVLIPATFLVWFGIAALIIGTLTLTGFADVAWWPWQAQLVAFAVLSFVMVFVGRKVFPSSRAPTDPTELNSPLNRWVGSEATLQEPIVDGVGRVKLGDTTWRVVGADTEAGAKVRVTSVKDGALQVERA
jgi:membrane protein implicated in regulation of membrane protease activity